MSYMIYLTLNGKKQGLISAGCSTLDSIGNRYQKGHEDQIQVLSLNHTITRNQNVSHHPIQFIKPVDKSSPLLAMAIDSNESLNGAFIFYRTSQTGQSELFYEVKITEATIVDISCTYPNSINSNELMPYEKIFLKYKSITWNHVTAGTSAYSIWDERVY
ncbi:MULTISPECIES: Hcp family type VI secretion system effector [Photorhabdus]|uniref:Hcp family type VI secretion system effector n=2 Tax=Photorhabdus TaxID=29487 RepID=A0A329X797_9GAMM|nr:MULTISPECIES: Hcp family type VI secretion system effector [Photorhabdus]MCC8374212.1 Hcp family type VI secretion system effector [Photorhabdus bodei]MCC8464613.1 Hcp family type VI secretion system effector [Photorhabdus bodei]MCT8352114.1 Hcp family type VI secretion system effector [Photorhabdus kayaii]MDB6369622.1 Hcp family type VI secretion system effector [Photorhabdus bodei]MDB6371712.1 Hcp family type VI secretion system effector [Photorhabdus bodei]